MRAEHCEELLWDVDNLGTVPGNPRKTVVDFGRYELDSTVVYGERVKVLSGYVPGTYPSMENSLHRMKRNLARDQKKRSRGAKAFGCPYCRGPFKVGRKQDALFHLYGTPASVKRKQFPCKVFRKEEPGRFAKGEKPSLNLVELPGPGPSRTQVEEESVYTDGESEGEDEIESESESDDSAGGDSRGENDGGSAASKPNSGGQESGVHETNSYVAEPEADSSRTIPGASDDAMGG